MKEKKEEKARASDFFEVRKVGQKEEKKKRKKSKGKKKWTKAFHQRVRDSPRSNRARR